MLVDLAIGIIILYYAIKRRTAASHRAMHHLGRFLDAEREARYIDLLCMRRLIVCREVPTESEEN